MSHITSYQTDIILDYSLSLGGEVEDDPGFLILEEAVLSVGEELGMEARPYIKDFYGRKADCDWALVGPKLPGGLGIRVHRESGEVIFLSDTYGGTEGLVSRVKGQILQAFTSLSLARAMASLNYQVEMEEVENPYGGKKVLLRGVI